MAGRYTPVYPIGVVKELTGLSERQIRYYDKTGVVVPKRTAGSKRLYSEADIDLLREVKILMGKGMRIEEVKEELARRRKDEAERLRTIEELGDVRARFGGPVGEVLAPGTGPPAPGTGSPGTGRSDIAPKKTGAGPSANGVRGPREPGEPRRLLKSVYPVRNHGELNKLIDEGQTRKA